MSYFRATLLSSVILGPGVSLFGLLLLSGCSDKIVTCQESKTCEASGGSGSGGTASGGGTGSTNSGGKGSGGDSNSSGGAQGGSTGDGDGDTGSGGTIDDHCLSCAEDAPVCVDEDCVACSETEQGSCSEQEVCSESNECVACASDEHCTDPSAPVCDLDTNECTGCTDSEGCAHFEDENTLACDTATKTCVECTPRTEATSCGDFSCDPASFTCTSTPRGESDACEPCLADSECKTNFRCVPMEFKGTAREGGFCLKDVTAGGCTEPYTSNTPARVSLSGAEAAVYCTVNETLTTCEAVLDLENNKECDSPGDCGAPGLDDGLCQTVTSSAETKCTYECSSPAQCRVDDPGSSCDGDASGIPVKYCGG